MNASAVFKRLFRVPVAFEIWSNVRSITCEIFRMATPVRRIDSVTSGILLWIVLLISFRMFSNFCWLWEIDWMSSSEINSSTLPTNVDTSGNCKEPDNHICFVWKHYCSISNGNKIKSKSKCASDELWRRMQFNKIVQVKIKSNATEDKMQRNEKKMNQEIENCMTYIQMTNE